MKLKEIRIGQFIKIDNGEERKTSATVIDQLNGLTIINFWAEGWEESYDWDLDLDTLGIEISPVVATQEEKNETIIKAAKAIAKAINMNEDLTIEELLGSPLFVKMIKKKL